MYAFSSVYLLDSAEQHSLHFQVSFNNLPGNTFTACASKEKKYFEITYKRQTINIRTTLPVLHFQVCRLTIYLVTHILFMGYNIVTHHVTYVPYLHYHYSLQLQAKNLLYLSYCCIVFIPIVLLLHSNHCITLETFIHLLAHFLLYPRHKLSYCLRISQRGLFGRPITIYN